MSAPVEQPWLSGISALDDPVASLGLHVALFTSDGSIVGDELLRLVNVEGQETMSDLFEFNLELHGNTDSEKQAPIDFRSLLGRPVTIGIETPGERSPDSSHDDFVNALNGNDNGRFAFFNGIVAGFSVEQPGVYRVTMRPKLWMLGLTNGYRHFASKSIRDVITDVLNRYRIDHRFADDVTAATSISVTRLQDWLQAGESDLELVRRLLGKAHLFYFFEQGAKTHSMVITGGEQAYSNATGNRPLRYTWTGIDELGLEQDDMVVQYAYQETLTSSHVAGTYVTQDAAWNIDGVAGFVTHPATSGRGDLPFSQYKVYQYGLCDQEAVSLAKAAEQGLEATRRQFNGASRCRRFAVGKCFTVSGSVQPGLGNTTFVLTSVKHQASLDGTYKNEFQAIPKAPFVAFSLQDTQQGAVLAKVIEGSPDDWRYYPRSVFDLQTKDETDTQAAPSTLKAKGVMVQTATGDKMWARLPPHMQSTPEVDAMVSLTRANDESELPEISTICSDGSMVVTPSGWTAHSSVGNNYSTSWGDSKSIRCGAATPDILDEARTIVENAYTTGEYKESSFSRGGGYSYSTSERGRAGLLSRSESYGNTYGKVEANETKNWSDIVSSYSESKIGTSTSSSTVGEQSSLSTVGMTTDTSLTGLHTSTSAIGLQTSSSAVGASSSVSMTGIQSNVSLSGLSNQANITGCSSSQSVTGIQSSIDATGSANRVSVTGSSNSVSMEGVGNTVSLAGVTNSVAMVGASNSVSMTGSSTNMSVVGTSNSVSMCAASTSVSINGTSTVLEINGPTMNLNVDGALVMSVDLGATRINVPGVAIQIDVAIELHL